MYLLERHRNSASALTVAIGLLFAALVATSAAAQDDPSFDAQIACPDGEVPDGRFTDGGATHGDAAHCLAWYGVARGTTATTFSPGQAVTRGQTATMATNLLSQLEGVSLPEPRAEAFTDVAGTAHRSAIEILAGFDPPLVAGFEDGTFRPGAPVTRGQFSTILANLLDEVAAQRSELEPLSPGAARFGDTADSVHEPAISRLAGAAIISGFPDGTFQPERSITRGQVATLFTGAMGGLADVGLLPEPPPAQEPDLTVELVLSPVASMDSATAGAVGPDNVLYLAERAGTVHPLTGSGAGPAVVDISAEVTTAGEGGLLGLAFAVDGSELYLSYTDTSGDTAIDAVAVDGDVTIQAEQRRRVYSLEQPFANHNGGDVQVGGDGLLYIGLGDGGGGGDPLDAGQDLSTPLGAMLRIDPLGGTPYRVPSDNPFVGQAGAVDEIFAYGLRNPWRFSFDRETGDLYIADVGQSTREEINHRPAGTAAGANFGWSRMEGTVPFQGATEPGDHVPPVYEYATGGPEGCAITGGFVYRGEAIPQLRGAYLYSDFCVGSIRAIVVGDDGGLVEQAGLGIEAGQVVSFAQDAQGELYVLGLGGSVHRIDPA